MRFYAFFTSERERRKWSSSRPGCFSSGGVPATLSTKIRVEPHRWFWYFWEKKTCEFLREKETCLKTKIWKRCSGSVAKMMCQGSNQLLGVPLQHTLVHCPQHMLSSLWQSKGIATNMSLNEIRAHSPWAHRSYCCSCVLVTGSIVLQYTHHCKNKRRTEIVE